MLQVALSVFALDYRLMREQLYALCMTRPLTARPPHRKRNIPFWFRAPVTDAVQLRIETWNLPPCLSTFGRQKAVEMIIALVIDVWPR